MKAKQIEVGGTYAAKVSGRIAPVKVLEVVERFDHKHRSRTVYLCRNVRTGRAVTVRSPQRFRYACCANGTPVHDERTAPIGQ